MRDVRREKLIYCFLSLIIIFIWGCGTVANPDKEAACQKTCDTMTRISSLAFGFEGYDSAEVATVLIRQINQAKRDTTKYYLKASYWIDYHGQPRKKSWNPYWLLDTTILLQNTIQVIVPNIDTHYVSEIKMKPHPECDMFDCNYVPVIGRCKIDEDSLQAVEQIIFTKK